MKSITNDTVWVEIMIEKSNNFYWEGYAEVQITQWKIMQCYGLHLKKLLKDTKRNY